MCKKYLQKILFILALVAMLVPSVIFAAGRAEPTGRAAPTVKGILPPATVMNPDSDGSNEGQSTENVDYVATGDLETSILPQVIKLFLGMVATISFCMFIYAGINMVISQGNEEEMTKFKTMMVWAVVGLIIITMSYAIVKGVLALNFEI